MKIVSTEEMRTIDRITTERFGLPSLTLMENAGSAVADVAIRLWPSAWRVVVVCGKGNNGGDGFVAARKLKSAGKQVHIVLLAHPEELKGDAAAMFSRMGLPFVTVTSEAEIKDILAPLVEQAEVVVDAILGTGIRPPVRGVYEKAIRVVNSAKATVLSVDIPSGADSDGMGPQCDIPIARSNAIVTFTAPRPAHVLSGLTTGPVFCYPIGSPDEALVSQFGLNLITPGDVADLFALRDPNGHKGAYGHALIVGGSVGKSGAAAMAGLSALRVGAGLSTVATAKSALPMIAGYAFELMTNALAETEAGTISAACQREFGAIAEGKDVIAFGPGISRHPDTVQFVRQAVTGCSVPAVVDADGLNAFEGATELLNGNNRPLVLTPHPGEMSRLAKLPTKQVQADRLAVAREFATKHKCVVVLKGHRTLVALPDETVWINPTGNPGMATGGTGDVLTGVTAGLIAQNPHAVERAVIAAAYLHGLAGDIAKERTGEQAMIAGDLIAALPEAIRRIQSATRQFVKF